MCWSADLRLHVTVLAQPIKIFDVLNVMVTVFLAAVPCTVIPRLTSDPADEFFG